MECQPSLEQHPGDDTDRGRRPLGDLGGQDAQPAAALLVEGGHGSRGLGLTHRVSVGSDVTPGLAHQDRHQVGASRAEGLADGVDEGVGQVEHGRGLRRS